MKPFFAVLFLSAGLASCSTNAPEPSPSLLGDTWTLQSEVSQATEATTGPEAPIKIAIDGQVTMRYTDEAHYFLDVKPLSRAGRHFESTYSLKGQTLVYKAIYSWTTEFVVPRTVQVTELDAHKLVLVEEYDFYEPWDKSQTHYVRTYTFSR